MADAIIIDSRKVPSIREGRLGKIDHYITYSLGPGRVFLLIVDDEGLTDQRITDAIKKDIEARGKLIGKTFPV